MADSPATPLKTLAAYCRRLGLRAEVRKAGEMSVAPDWPTQPRLYVRLAPHTAWLSPTQIEWDGCRAAPTAQALPQPAASLVLAYTLEHYRSTGQMPTPPSSVAEWVLALLDLGDAFPEIQALLEAWLSNFLDQQKKKRIPDSETYVRREIERLAQTGSQDLAACVGWLAVMGFFRRSRADQREIAEQLAASRQAEKHPPCPSAWFDAALLLAKQLAREPVVALTSPQVADWHARNARLALGLQWVAPDEPSACLSIYDERQADQPIEVPACAYPLIVLQPRKWWAARGFHRWRQRLARRFDLLLAADDPEIDFRLAVLVPREAGKGLRPRLVRFHKPLVDLLPADSSSPHHRRDRLQALFETTQQAPTDSASLYRLGEIDLTEERWPSLRLRRFAGTADTPAAWALAQSVPTWWLSLLSCGAWLPAAAAIDFRTRNLRGWAAAWALGAHWPMAPELYPASMAPRQTERWLVARETRWQPWLESGLFWRLCRLADREGVPWEQVLRLPDVAAWPDSVLQAHGAARDAALVEYLAGSVAPQVIALLAEDDASTTPNPRPDPAYDAYARDCRSLLPPRPTSEQLYRPLSPRDPPTYWALDSVELSGFGESLRWDYFLGQYAWVDAQGQARWQGSSWAQGAWLGVQAARDERRTYPRDPDHAAALVERYRQLRESTRRLLRRAAFVRNRQRALAKLWAERLVQAAVGPPLPSAFGYSD